MNTTQTMFTLKNTYEDIFRNEKYFLVFRIEIFHAMHNEKIKRARIWVNNTYNLYPTNLNITENGGLKNSIWSCDEINREITLILADEPELITGKEIENDEVLLHKIKILIDKYVATYCS